MTAPRTPDDDNPYGCSLAIVFVAVFAAAYIGTGPEHHDFETIRGQVAERLGDWLVRPLVDWLGPVGAAGAVVVAGLFLAIQFIGFGTTKK